MTTSTDRDPALTVYQDEPFNTGTPLALLRRSFTTPQALFYARNHAAIPCAATSRIRATMHLYRCADARRRASTAESASLTVRDSRTDADNPIASSETSTPRACYPCGNALGPAAAGRYRWPSSGITVTEAGYAPACQDEEENTMKERRVRCKQCGERSPSCALSVSAPRRSATSAVRTANRSRRATECARCAPA